MPNAGKIGPDGLRIIRLDRIAIAQTPIHRNSRAQRRQLVQPYPNERFAVFIPRVDFIRQIRPGIISKTQFASIARLPDFGIIKAYIALIEPKEHWKIRQRRSSVRASDGERRAVYERFGRAGDNAERRLGFGAIIVGRFLDGSLYPIFAAAETGKVERDIFAILLGRICVNRRAEIDMTSRRRGGFAREPIGLIKIGNRVGRLGYRPADFHRIGIGRVAIPTKTVLQHNLQRINANVLCRRRTRNRVREVHLRNLRVELSIVNNRL